MPNDKLISHPAAPLEKVAPELPPAIALIKLFDEPLAMRALAIMAARPEKQSLSPDRAIAAALHEQKTGQVCGREFYIDQFMGIVPGYRGVARETKEAGAGRWDKTYRQMTPEEREEHECQPGDYAYICELTLYENAKDAKAIGIPYHPTLGYGIVKKAEKKNSDGKDIQLKGGFNWVRKAQNRAYKDALRHAGLGDTAEQILEDAEAEGVPIGFDADKRQYLTVDQARIVVDRARGQAARDARPEAEKQAERAQTAAAMRQSKYTGRMGMADRCPDCGAELPDHTDACQWFEFAPRYGSIEDIPDAHAERGEDALSALSPAQEIRARLQVEAAGISGDATDRDRQWGVASLTKLWPDEDRRHAVSAWLYGKASTKDMSRGELVAAKNLAGLTKTRNQDVADPDAKGAWLWIPTESGTRAARIISAELFPEQGGTWIDPATLPAEVTP